MPLAFSAYWNDRLTPHMVDDTDKGDTSQREIGIPRKNHEREGIAADSEEGQLCQSSAGNKQTPPKVLSTLGSNHVSYEQIF